VFGNWLDEKYGWSCTAVLVILGVMAGARNSWILVKEIQQSGTKGRLQDERKDQ
jgi:ATP synthase protein I